VKPVPKDWIDRVRADVRRTAERLPPDVRHAALISGTTATAPQRARLNPQGVWNMYDEAFFGFPDWVNDGYRPPRMIIVDPELTKEEVEHIRAIFKRLYPTVPFAAERQPPEYRDVL
jgi:hypothetical protein